MHSIQFETLGSIDFYAAYGAGALDAIASGREAYNGNVVESSAKNLAQTLADNFSQEKPCG